MYHFFIYIIYVRVSFRIRNVSNAFSHGGTFRIRNVSNAFSHGGTFFAVQMSHLITYVMLFVKRVPVLAM